MKPLFPSPQKFLWTRLPAGKERQAESFSRKRFLTVRKRTILSVSFTLIGLVGAVYTTAAIILSNSIRNAEEQSVQQTTEGVFNLLDQTYADFAGRFPDWSAWNDTYNFINNRNSTYIESNLDPIALASMNVNLVMYFNAEGKLIYGTQINPTTRKAIPISSAIREQISPESPILRSPKRLNVLTGLLTLPDGVMLVTAQPILTSQGRGPMRGTLVFGRYLEIANLQKLVSRSVLKIYPAGQAKLPQELLEQTKVQDQKIVVRAIDETTIAGYRYLNDLFNEPTLMIQVTMPRSIHQQGQTNLRSLLLSLISVGLIFWLITLLLLEKQATLYQQIEQLNDELEDQVQERTAQLSQALSFEALLKRITDKVRDSLDENQILQTVVQELAQELSIVCCDTAIYNLEQQTSTIVSEFVGYLPPAKGSSIDITAFPELYTPLFQGQYIHCCSLSAPTLRPLSKQNAMLVCPIFDDRGVLGDLWLFGQPYGAFNEAEIRLVQQVSNQCAIAIRQARLYHAAQTQVAELERLNRLKDDFLSTVSHELRTPMSSIKMGIQMLDIALQNVDLKPTTLDLQCITKHPRVSRYLSILYDECEREINIINDLLDLSRLEAGGETLVFSTIEPHSWLLQLTQPFLDRTQTQQQEFHLQIPATLPALVTDASKLERILTELLNNACKYTPAGHGITVTAQTKSNTPEWLVFTVSNSGVELPLEELERLFDKFYRVPNNDPWKHGGTGLGLALVQRLVMYLGGRIWVDNIEHTIRFTVELPIEPPSTTPAL